MHSPSLAATSTFHSAHGHDEKRRAQSVSSDTRLPTLTGGMQSTLCSRSKSGNFDRGPAYSDRGRRRSRIWPTWQFRSTSLRYSRGDERQADENSVDLCQKAGFNPAGIYLAMIKLQRMSQETGGEPPKILSTHPLTKDRIVYLQKLLESKGIPIPKEDTAGDLPSPDKVGSVILATLAAKSGTIRFSATKPLHVGDVVWLMHHGWDYRYENRTWVPAARGIVTSVGADYTARIWPTPTAHSKDIAANVGVYCPAVPPLPKGICVIPPTIATTVGSAGLPADAGLRQFNRVLA